MANLSIKEILIKKIAVNRVTEKLISEGVIDAVITHEFSCAHKATNECNSIEISGFGKFMFNQAKAIKKIETAEKVKAKLEKMLEDESISDTKRRNAQMKIASIIKNIKDLKPKIDKYETS